MSEYNITYQNDPEDISYDHGVHISAGIRETWVYYKRSEESRESVDKGPDLYVINVKGNIEEVTISEVFNVYRELHKLAGIENVLISEEFSFGFSEDYLLFTTDPQSIEEVFSKEFVPAIRDSLVDATQISEVFEKEYLPALRSFVDFSVEVKEVFSFSLIEALKSNVNETLSVDEVFSFALVEGKNQTQEETIQITESFSFRFANAFTRSRSESIAVREIFSFSKLEVINKSRNEVVSVGEVFSRSFESGIRPPENLTGFDAGSCTIALSWDTPQSGDPDHYELQILISGNWNIVTNNIPGVNNAYDVDMSSYGNGDYHFRIRSVGNFGSISDWEQTNNTIGLAFCGGGF